MGKEDRVVDPGFDSWAHLDYVASITGGSGGKTLNKRLCVPIEGGKENTAMARVRATCDHCGDTELSIEAVSVRICREDHDGTYSFRCPECGASHEKGASRRTLDLLVSSGADVTFWSVPVERLVDMGIGPLTHDYLLEFHERLQDDAGLAAALGELVGD
jgi:DNA-directed RNA polymerase subunit M/transcription elongation factor TFIIS